MVESYPTRRDVLGVTGAAILGGVAGCSGDGGGDGSDGGGDGGGDGSDGGGDGGGDGSDGGGDGGGGATREAMCGVSAGGIDGLAVVGCQSEASGSKFTVTVTVENTGSQNVDLSNYEVEIDFYETSEPSIQGELFGGAFVRTPNADLAPGDTGQVIYELTLDGSADQVSHYEVTLECDPFGEGVYCG